MRGGAAFAGPVAADDRGRTGAWRAVMPAMHTTDIAAIDTAGKG
ncbi:hypothetical protein [Thalassococcus arenae]|nr:hypothetical protein [Thalassococcus arenae]